MPPFAELAPFLVALPLAGAAAGLIAGLMGVGGGIVIVPVLFHLFTGLGIDDSVRMHVSVGTSLAVIIATAISSTRSHLQKGSVDTALLRSWAPFVIIGVAVGALCASFLRGPALSGFFAVIAFFVAFHMAFGKEEWRLGDQLPGGAAMAAIAAAIGAVSAMMGIGGGALTVPIMTLYGYPIRRAVGTASAIGLLIAVPGAVGFIMSGWDAPGRPPFSIGYVNILSAAIVLPLSVATAPWGAALAHSLDARLLRRIFALFLAFTSLRMFWSLF